MEIVYCFLIVELLSCVFCVKLGLNIWDCYNNCDIKGKIILMVE